MVKTGSKAQLIVRRPGVQGGEPIIRGTRVPVRSVALARNEDGLEPAAIAREFCLDLAAGPPLRDRLRPLSRGGRQPGDMRGQAGSRCLPDQLAASPTARLWQAEGLFGGQRSAGRNRRRFVQVVDMLARWIASW